MQQRLGHEMVEETLLLAGRRVQPGRYRELGTGRIVELEQEDVLPASLDGRVACYVRIYEWAQFTSQSLSQSCYPRAEEMMT